MASQNNPISASISIADILNASIEFESDDKCNFCASEIEAVEKEIASIEKECKLLRQKYHDKLVENLKKDVEIEQMELQIQDKSDYADFTEHFSDDSMKNIRSLGLTEASDSKFVLAVVRGLYENRLEVLQNKNLSGRSKLANKEPMTPEKMGIIKDIFSKRTNGSNESDKRRQNLRKMVKSAIETINKTQH